MSREGDTFAIHSKSTTVQCWWLGQVLHRKTQEMVIPKNCSDYSSLVDGQCPGPYTHYIVSWQRDKTASSILKCCLQWHIIYRPGKTKRSPCSSFWNKPTKQEQPTELAVESPHSEPALTNHFTKRLIAVKDNRLLKGVYGVCSSLSLFQNKWGKQKTPGNLLLGKFKLAFNSPPLCWVICNRRSGSLGIWSAEKWRWGRQECAPDVWRSTIPINICLSAVLGHGYVCIYNLFLHCFIGF